MIFKCKNCGGNVIYSPERHKMFCPYCESEESQDIQDSNEGVMTQCPDCGGEVPVKEHTAATQCPYCSNYIILNERVEGEYYPRLLIPFQLGKETCKQSIREKFKRHVFAPTDFLSEVRLNSMQGTYVPFWFYDYDINVDYQGEGTKVRSWTSGNTQYTETSYYDVRRNVDIDFQNIPADASVDMPDDVMDLMEPYDYKQLEDFEPKFLSGFFADKYHMRAEEIEGRARKKMQDDTNQLVKEQISGYHSIRQIRNNLSVRRAESSYGLLPVWKYLYTYHNQEYPFYVNGQTGKIVGNPPTSTKKVLAYSATLWGCLTVIATCLSVLATMLVL